MTTARPEFTGALGASGERYRVVSELGRGGTSIVYLARDREEGRDVAIKVIRSSHLDDAEAVARLQREARILERLDHPCIVRLLDTLMLVDGRLALVMDYVPGRTLKQVLRDGGPLPLKQVEQVLLDVAAALEHANEHGVVHRDVKPENIFIDDEGRSRLADFGIARMGRAASDMTLSGSTIGTPSYMSPEQIDGEAIDGRSDLYSLGMTAFEILTGRTPWAGENLYTVIYRQKHSELPSLRKLRPDAPPHLIRAISGLTRKHAVARWNTAQEFRIHLEHGIAASANAPGLPTPADHASPVVTDDSPTLPFVRPGRFEASTADSGASAGGGHDTAARIDRVANANSRILAPRERRTSVHQDESEMLAAKRRTSRTRPAHAGRARRRRRTVIAGIALVVIASSGTLAMIVEHNGTDFDSDTMGPVVSTSGSGTATPAESPIAPALDALPVDSTRETQMDPSAEPSSEPARMTVVTGDGQTALAGDVLAAPIVIRVEDGDGEAVSNARVAFSVATGGGNVAPAEALTDARGRAAAAWSMGTTAGPNALDVSVTGSGVAARINATGQVGPVQRLVVADGDDGPGSAPSRRVTFRAQDRHGNPVAGTRVDIRVAAGGGTVEPASVSTPATGEARTTWTLGPDSANRIAAAVRGTDIRIDYAPPPLRLSVRSVISAGGTHSCALASSGVVRCWGGSEHGQLGSGRTSRQDGLVRVLASAQLTRVATGISHSCALDATGTARCWGLNSNGQLGTGDRAGQPAPSAVAGTARFMEIAAGLAHTCAIAEGGGALCWGEGSYGQIGHGAATNRLAPTAVAGGHTFSSISTGWRHTCALTSQNTAWCWGANDSGQLGDGSTATRSAPVRVAGGLRFRSISAGASHTCGITTEGVAYCWGGNDHGQTGRDGNSSREPVAVTAPVAFASVAAGAVHTCALTRSGEALCWGRNNFGQLGNESLDDSAEPVRVAGGFQFASLSASGSHTCARASSGRDYCWGYNVEGQLGDGTRANRSRPVPVGPSD